MDCPRWFLLFVFTARLCSIAFVAAADESPSAVPAKHYEYRATPSRDGIGKVYLGREISFVMGHQGANWLERPERETEEHTDKLIELLKLKSGEVIADIGAGTGYMTRRLARRIGAAGRAWAVDIQPEMLTILTNKLTGEGITNVTAQLGTILDPGLPSASMDTILMVDVYHEFSHPHEMMKSMVQSLKPGGRMVWVEFRAEDPAVPIYPLHKMTEAQVKKEATFHGLEWVETMKDLPRQHVIVFRKPKAKSSP